MTNKYYYKFDEVKEYVADNIECLIGTEIDELHHNLFNTDYYIIGTYRATQWLGEEVFNVINIIKEWEQDNFGEVSTDFSEAENVVNMYTYIIGEMVLSDVHDYKYEGELTEAMTKEIINNLGGV